MATKKTVARKTVAKSSSAAAKKKINGKRVVKALYREKNPDRHVMTGKFVFFYILFACTTLFFAVLSVWLYIFASEVMNKYESVDACVRAHTTCTVNANSDGSINVEEQ